MLSGINFRQTSIYAPRLYQYLDFILNILKKIMYAQLVYTFLGHLNVRKNVRLASTNAICSNWLVIVIFKSVIYNQYYLYLKCTRVRVMRMQQIIHGERHDRQNITQYHIKSHTQKKIQIKCNLIFTSTCSCLIVKVCLFLEKYIYTQTI